MSRLLAGSFDGCAYVIDGSHQKIKNDESECRQKGATSSHEIMYGPPRKSFSSFFLVHEIQKQS